MLRDGVDIPPRTFIIDRAALWSIGQQFGRQGIGYLAFTILALLLTPEDFGLVGVALVWINLGQIVADLGFGAAIIQRGEVREEHLSTTFALNIAIGALLTLAGAAGAGPIAGLFDVPQAEPIIRLLSTTFLLRAVGLTHAVIAQRNLDFRGLAVRDTIAAAGGACVGIALALSGFDVYALVWQSIAASLLGSLLFWRMSAWRPRMRHCSAKALRDLWSYSSRIFLFGLFKFLTQNADKFVVANLLGPAALGIYTMAYRLVLVPTTAFVGAVGSYLFPKIAALQGNTAGARAAFFEAMAFTARVITPVVVATMLFGPAIVALVYGDEWAAASELLPIMAIIAAGTALISPAGQVMKACGRPEWLFWWAVGFTCLIVVSLAVGAPWGLTGVATALAIAHLLGVVVIQASLRSLLGFGTMDTAKVVRAPLLASAGGAALALLVSRGLPVGPVLRLTGASIIFVAAYLAVLTFILRRRPESTAASPLS